MEHQILIGTPKEVAAFSLMRLFDIEKISLCVVDDADEVYTSDVVKNHIVNRLRSCQKVMISATKLNSILSNDHYTTMSRMIPLNCMHFYIKVDSVVNKLQAIVKVYNVVKNTGAKAIVFFGVIFNLFVSLNFVFDSFISLYLFCADTPES